MIIASHSHGAVPVNFKLKPAGRAALRIRGSLGGSKSSSSSSLSQSTTQTAVSLWVTDWAPDCPGRGQSRLLSRAAGAGDHPSSEPESVRCCSPGPGARARTLLRVADPCCAAAAGAVATELVAQLGKLKDLVARVYSWVPSWSREIKINHARARTNPASCLQVAHSLNVKPHSACP